METPEVAEALSRMDDAALGAEVERLRGALVTEREDNLTLDQVEKLLETWKLRGLGGG